MNLKYIEFIFESCDMITIDGKYIGHFLVDDLNTSFARTACNHIGKIETAKTFAIEIHKDANKERYQHEQTQYEDFKQMTFDRFAGNDITSIRFKLSCDDVREFEEEDIDSADCYHYYVDWTGDDDYVNEAQSCYISKDGHLYLVISDGKTIEDFFDMEEINDSDYMDFHFDMCDVGDEIK